MSATANRIVKNTGFLYARMGITMFISLWTTRIILNALGASDFGIFTIVGGAMGMLSFLNASMATATQRFLSYYQGVGDKDKIKEVFHTSVFLHIIISVVLVICFIFAGLLFFNYILNIPENRIRAAYIIYGCLVVSTAFTVMTVPFDATLNAHENMRYYAIIGVFESVLKLLAAFIVIYAMSDKLIVYGILMACIPILLLVIMRTYCLRHYDECHISLRRRIDKGLVKEMTSFAGWNLMTLFSSVFTQYGLGIVLNHFYGALLNAAQGIANQLSGMLMAFCNSMLKALSPSITKKTGAGQKQQVVLATLLGSKYSFLLLAVFAVPCIIEMPSVLRLWLKSIPEWCILFCQLQLIRSVIEQLFITLKTAISAQGQIKQFSVINGVLNVFPFLLTYILFSKGYPPYVMYVTWILCYSVGGGVSLVYYSKHLCVIPYNMFFKIVFLPCVVMLIFMLLSGSISSILIPTSYFRILITFTLTTIGLLGAFLMFISNVERLYLTNLLKSKVHI